MRLTNKDKIKELLTLEKHKITMTNNDYKELKLGKLEDLEEELGIELITLFNLFDLYRFENRCLLEKNQRLIEIIKSDKKLYKRYKNELGL